MLVDVHCHLQFSQFDEDRDEVIARCKKNNLAVVITSGTDHINNAKALQLAREYDIVKASIGLYPDDIVALPEDEIENEIEFIINKRDDIIAVGEIGLDYKNTKDVGAREKQKRYFKRLLELAEKLNKPVILHTRDAESDVVSMLESTKLKDVIFHCFTGNYKLVKRISDRGWFFSVPPIILRSLHFQGLARNVPITQLLTETDSPYLAPPPKQRNEPSFVTYTIDKISEIKNMNKDEVARNIFANFQTIFLKK